MHLRGGNFLAIGMHNITQQVLPGISPVGSNPVLLTSIGLAIGSLSPQESAFYPTLFTIAAGNKPVKENSVIPASVAASFLKRSGLSKKQLHEIWCLSDPEDLGFLTQEGFYKACRLVAHAQCGSGYVGADQLGMEPQSLPFFEGASGSPEEAWRLSDSEIQRYAELFRREGATTKLDGNDARGLLSRSGLSNSELCDIWDLADVDKDGKLTFGEFLVAMQLISKVRDGKVFFPSVLPDILRSYLATILPAAAPQVVVSTGPTGIAPTLGPPIGPSSGPMTGTDPTLEPRRDHIPTQALILSKKEEESILERELASEKRMVGQSIDRRRQFRKQVLDGRARLASLKEEAKKSEMALMSVDHAMEKIQDQILSLKQQIDEGEEELDQFRRESGQIAGGDDVLAAVSSIKRSIGDDEKEVLELRMQLERVQREKLDLQSSLAVVRERKRIADQDRNMLISGLENERAKLVALRAERLKLWEQRHQLTRELTTKTFDKLNHNTNATKLPVRSVRDRKGVKADHDVPAHADLKTSWSSFG